MNTTDDAPMPTAQAPQSLQLDARATAMLKAMGVHWRWPTPTSVAAAQAEAPTPSADATSRNPTEVSTAPDTRELAARSSPSAEPAAPPLAPPSAAAARREPSGSGSEPRPSDSITPKSDSVSPASVALAPSWDHLNWEGLQEQARSCQACGLSNGRVGHSWGQGSARARWLFVTPRLHPADTGDETVHGDEAALLQSLWRAMGLAADEVFVTALTKCRAAMGLHASAADTAQCLGFLQHQVRWLQPDMIVALGLPVAHALWGHSDAPLAQWRGQLHHWRDTPTVVTYPLDALLRRPVDKTKAWADMCLALDHLNTLSKPT